MINDAVLVVENECILVSLQSILLNYDPFSFQFSFLPTKLTTTPVTPASAEYNITFKLNNNFQTELSNMSSIEATKLASNITTEVIVF